MKLKNTEYVQALGFHLAWLPPLLLIAGASTGRPWLAFAVLMGGLTLMRVAVGDSPKACPEWSEAVATELETVPMIGAVLYLLSLVSVAQGLGRALHAGEVLGYVASLWAASLFASCVSHELLHRRGTASRLLGRVQAGALGYPLLEHEHVVHHVGAIQTSVDERPRADESMWGFSVRRLVRVARLAYERDLTISLRRGHRLAGGLPVAVGATAAAGVVFANLAGPAGLAVYLMTALLTSWAIQATTYLQHWAMGRGDAGPDAAAEFCWEDRCQLQAWITLGASFHQAHHRLPGCPFYRLAPCADAPCQPAGYLILLLISMVPQAWRRLMVPTLRTWRMSTMRHQGAGRRLICFNGDALLRRGVKGAEFD